MFDKIIDSVLTFGAYNDEELTLLKDRLISLKIVKEDYLLNLGNTCQSICFVNSGSFRHFQIGADYHEINHQLYVTNDWVLDHQSFTLQKPSKCQIQAVEDSEVLELKIDDIHELIRISPSFFKMGKVLERVAVNMYHQSSQMTPEEKYLHLMEEKPQLLQAFSLKHIASYLGMTPETLSRVRKKISIG